MIVRKCFASVSLIKRWTYVCTMHYVKLENIKRMCGDLLCMSEWKNQGEEYDKENQNIIMGIWEGEMEIMQFIFYIYMQRSMHM